MEPATTAVVSRKPYFFVLQSGVITTVIALAGVYLLNSKTEDVNIMGWYANYILPVGAVIVGFVAGSGYGLASWFSGTRISRWLLVMVVLFQAAGYLGAEYVEYRGVLSTLDEQGLVLADTGEAPTFFQYYDLKARNFAWKSKHGGGEERPMGAWGYFFVLLGAVGFIASGLIAPAILFAVPYCDACERYMSSKVLGVVPASVAVKKIGKADTKAQEAHDAEQTQAGQSAEVAVQRLRDAAAAGDADAFKTELASHGPTKQAHKLPRRVEIKLVWCKSCDGGHIQPTVLIGQGDKAQQNPMEKIATSPDFVRMALGSPSAG